MKTDDFNYELPESLIAQTPLKERDQSRLMVLDKATGKVEHKHFYDVIDYLEEGDVLVLNDTKVMPARLFGVKEETGSHIEILMLKELGNDTWECLTRPAKRISVGTVVDFGGGTCDFAVMDGGRIVSAWGEPALGGRLFDDLFFQWFLDENPKMLDALRKDGREIFTLLEDCKEIK